jgi:hypothetical protein
MVLHGMCLKVGKDRFLPNPLQYRLYKLREVCGSGSAPSTLQADAMHSSDSGVPNSRLVPILPASPLPKWLPALCSLLHFFLVFPLAQQRHLRFGLSSLRIL